VALHRFVAELECPECGERSTAEILTPLGPPDYDRVMHVGDRADELTWASVRTFYPVLREPEPGEPIRLMETWWCMSCDSRAWALITISDETVRSIEAVPLTQATVRRANAITDEVEEVFRSKTGLSLGLCGGATGFEDDLRAALPP
jgi:hypothetical protein